MKLLTLAIATALSLASNATTTKVFAADNYPTSLLCAAAANNKLRQYRSTLREFRLSEKYSANNVTCNGDNIARFAAKYHAQRTVEHINKFRTSQVSITDIAMLNSDVDDVIINTVN